MPIFIGTSGEMLCVRALGEIKKIASPVYMTNDPIIRLVNKLQKCRIFRVETVYFR
jgi:hypothetical protein